MEIVDEISPLNIISPRPHDVHVFPSQIPIPLMVDTPSIYVYNSTSLQR